MSRLRQVTRTTRKKRRTSQELSGENEVGIRMENAIDERERRLRRPGYQEADCREFGEKRRTEQCMHG